MMAASTYSNIRLDTDVTGASLPVNIYKVLWEGDLRLLEPAVSTERSLTGKLHVHKLLDGANPKVFDGRRYKMLLTGQSEVSQLAADLGKVVYFMANYRDEGDTATYRETMFFKSMRDVTAVDASETYFYATIELEEATNQSV
jgi:hypothetical protein